MEHPQPFAFDSHREALAALELAPAWRANRLRRGAGLRTIRRPRWCSGSYRPAVGHGLAHLLGQGLGELRVGLSAERVVDRGERQAKGHEGGDGEDLSVIEAG